MAVSTSVVLRAKRFRRRPAVKLFWLWWAPALSVSVPITISVRATAEATGLKPDNVRRALRLLLRLRYLHCTKPTTDGTAGEYVAGPRAVRDPQWVPPAGTAGGPVRPLHELPLVREVA